MHYCQNLVCACQEGGTPLWWMKCFFNMQEDNKASLMLFRVGIDVCLEILASRGNIFSSKLIAFIY
jgi:hypothetical protein